MNDTHKYDEIIGMEHPTSKRHPRMSMKERAAQFAPFAAFGNPPTETPESSHTGQE